MCTSWTDFLKLPSRTALAAGAISASLVISGCASAPKERFYTLSTVSPGSSASGFQGASTSPVPSGLPASAGNAAHLTLMLTALALPELYDRPQFVVRADANRVEIKEEHRWAQSLRLEIARVLAADLGARMPNAVLLSADARPTPAAGPDYRVGVSIEQFDALPGQAVEVQANWTIRGNGGGSGTGSGGTGNITSNGNRAAVSAPQTINGRSNVREAVDGPGYEALAAAYSRALGSISSDIAARIASLARPSR